MMRCVDVDLQFCGTVEKRGYGDTCMWICGIVGLCIYRFLVLWKFDRVGKWICENVYMRINSYVGVRIGREADLWNCGNVGLQIDAWIDR